jgi:hypothetical protein
MSATPTLPSPDVTTEAPVEYVWAALQSLIVASIGAALDVRSIGMEDFDADDALIVMPPAARVLFLEETAEPIENQARNYTRKMRFAVLCADEDRGPDPQDQRNKSIVLAGLVTHYVAGARLPLPSGDTTEPIVWLGTKPMPAAELGMCYVVAFAVECTAYFAAPNAYPQLPEDPSNA